MINITCDVCGEILEYVEDYESVVRCPNGHYMKRFKDVTI